MGRSQPQSSFSQAFGIHHALQLAVSTASRAGVSVWPESLATALMAEFPNSGMSQAEVRTAIVKAADSVRVPIKQAAKRLRRVASRASGHVLA